MSNAIEVFIKLVLTAFYGVVVFYGGSYLIKVWKGHVDAVSTINRFVEQWKPKTNLIAIRDPSKIYQNREALADVTGDVIKDGSRVIFKRLENAGHLKRAEPFEYQRERYKIIKHGDYWSKFTVIDDTGRHDRLEVLEDVVCELVK
jgi:hypothetical protein